MSETLSLSAILARQQEERDALLDRLHPPTGEAPRADNGQGAETTDTTTKEG